jgi:hypothetical protein
MKATTVEAPTMEASAVKASAVKAPASMEGVSRSNPKQAQAGDNDYEQF